MTAANNFASGAKGQRFESSRAYHPSSDFHSLTRIVRTAWVGLTACPLRFLFVSDQQLTSRQLAGQTVTERAV